MTNNFNSERFTEENVEKAFRKLSQDQDFDLVRYAILSRYADVRNLLPLTDGKTLNRVVGKMQELEWVLERFGEPLYGGLPQATETSASDGAASPTAFGAEIGGGYPDGFGSRSPL